MQLSVSLEEAEKRFMKENRPTSLIEHLIDPKEVADFVTYVSSPLSSAACFEFASKQARAVEPSF
jgi:hypothetical protein